MRIDSNDGSNADCHPMRAFAASATACCLCLLLAPPAVAQPAAGGGHVRIDVADHQHVTMTGSSDSLRDAVQQLCAAAGVQLRAYDAADRPFSAHYEDIALDQLFARLLRPDSYMVGLRTADEGKPDIAWLRVIGTGGDSGPVTPLPVVPAAVAATPVDVGSGPPSQLGVSHDVFEAAMSDQTYEKRRRATDAIMDKVKQNPPVLDGFLTRSADEIAQEIAGYPYAMYLIMHIQQLPLGDQAEPAGVVKSKLSAIVHAIRQRKNQS